MLDTKRRSLRVSKVCMPKEPMCKYNRSGQIDRQLEKEKERQCGSVEPRTMLHHANPQSWAFGNSPRAHTFCGGTTDRSAVENSDQKDDGQTQTLMIYEHYCENLSICHSCHLLHLLNVWFKLFKRLCLHG